MNRGFAFAVLLAGCSEDFESPTLLRRTQIIAATTTVEGDLERASPSAEETMNASLTVVGPRGPESLAWGFVTCVPAASRYGIDFCEGEPLDISLQPDPLQPSEGVQPSFTLELQDLDEEVESLLVLGVVCVNGSVSPLLDITSVNDLCVGADVEENPFTFLVPVGTENHNPAFGEIELGGDLWEFDATFDGTITDCDELPSAPLVTFDSDETEMKIEMEIGVTEASRETFESMDDDEVVSVVEELTISHLTTKGSVQRLFSFIEGDAETTTVEWYPPENADERNEGPVRVHFAIRDGRGGSATASRTFCYRP